jgi:hypothetical protein
MQSWGCKKRGPRNPILSGFGAKPEKKLFGRLRLPKLHEAKNVVRALHVDQHWYGDLVITGDNKGYSQ